MPFSAKSRNVIKKRAGGLSEVTGQNTEPMVCAHKNHTRDENYDNPENAHLLKQSEHFFQHNMYQNLMNNPPEWITAKEAERQNGLTPEQNRPAQMGLFVSWHIWKYQRGEISAAELVAIKSDYFDKYPWEARES